jgi:hypothetical protein
LNYQIIKSNGYWVFKPTKRRYRQESYRKEKGNVKDNGSEEKEG